MKPARPTPEAYAAAAEQLACDPRAIQAVAQVEAGPNGAFLPNGDPVILFERAKFHRHTAGRFDGTRLDGAPEAWSLISAPVWGGYGPLEAQHRKLTLAATLDKPAALKSCSWGLYQILGENHIACGFKTVEAYVTAMYRSVEDHLAAFVSYVREDHRLVSALRLISDEDNRVIACAAFARIYNGPQFAANRYDAKIKRAYDALVAGESRA